MTAAAGPLPPPPYERCLCGNVKSNAARCNRCETREVVERVVSFCWCCRNELTPGPSRYCGRCPRITTERRRARQREYQRERYGQIREAGIRSLRGWGVE